MSLVKTPQSNLTNSTREISWLNTALNCWLVRSELPLTRPSKPALPLDALLVIWFLMVILIGTKTGTPLTTTSRTRNSALPCVPSLTRKSLLSATSGTRTERCRKTSTADCTRLVSCPALSAWCLVSNARHACPGKLLTVVTKGPTDYVGTNIAGGIKPEEWDSFHELILLDEMCRCGSGGVIWGTLLMS